MVDGYYTPKDIKELTGLSRREVSDYKVIVKPAKLKNRGYVTRDGVEHGGYRLYDEEAMNRFRMIAMLKKLGMSPSVIIKKMKDKNFDYNQVISEQIAAREEEKRQIETSIRLAEQMEIINIKSELAGFLIKSDLSVLADWNEKLLEVPCYQELTRNYEEIDQWTKVYANFCEKCVCNKNEDPCSDKSYQIVHEFCEEMKCQYGMTGLLLVAVFPLFYAGGGEVKKDLIDEILSEEESAYMYAAMKHYLHKRYEMFLEQLGDIAAKHHKTFGKKYSESEAEKLSEDLAILWKEYLGIEQKEEYKYFFSIIPPDAWKEKSKMRYLLEVLNYYKNKGEST